MLWSASRRVWPSEARAWRGEAHPMSDVQATAHPGEHGDSTEASSDREDDSRVGGQTPGGITVMREISVQTHDYES
jgi:hypothetical protein